MKKYNEYARVSLGKKEDQDPIIYQLLNVVIFSSSSISTALAYQLNFSSYHRKRGKMNKLFHKWIINFDYPASRSSKKPLLTRK